MARDGAAPDGAARDGLTANAGGVALLERAVSYTLGSLHRVTPAALSRASPCRGWDLRTLLCHLDESLVALIAAVDSPVRVPGPGAGEAFDPVPAVRQHAGQLVGAWTGRPTPPTVAIDGSLGGGAVLSDAVLSDAVLSGAVVSGTGAIEVAVHGWDIARACGVHHPIPSALAGELLDLAVLLVTEAERPVLFAAQVAPPPRAGFGDRLVAYLGRNPSTVDD